MSSYKINTALKGEWDSILIIYYLHLITFISFPTLGVNEHQFTIISYSCSVFYIIES